MSSFQVFHFINSIFAHRANIGYRTYQICKVLAQKKINYIVFARDTAVIDKHVLKILPLGAFIPRLLNAYRILINPKFDHRKFDIWFYEKFAIHAIDKINAGMIHGTRIAHVWEYSPMLISKLKNMGLKVILDLPIAHTNIAVEFQKKGIYFDFVVKDIPSYMDESIRNADHLVVPSAFVLNSLKHLNLNKKNISIIPFGADPIKEKPKFILKKPGDSLVFGFAGNVSLRKGIQFLLDAWNDRRFKKDTLVLIGRVTKKAAELLKTRNFKNILVKGYTDNVIDEIKKIDVYVFPTLMEGSSKSVYEAMSLGKPVVTTFNAGSIICNGKDGYIIPPADPITLKDRMIKFKMQPRLIAKMGYAAYQHSKHYTWERYGLRLVNLYRSLKP